MNKKIALLFLAGLLATAALALSEVNASAQREQPLAEMALQNSELPSGSRVLSIGQTSFDDLSQPINSLNSARFGTSHFLEAYKIAAVNDNLGVSHYLYRYENSTQSEAQASALLAYMLQGEKSQPFKPLVISNKSAAAPNSLEGKSIQVTDPETGGVYYWFVATKGRDLMLLLVEGGPSDQTKTAFDALITRIQQR